MNLQRLALLFSLLIVGLIGCGGIDDAADDTSRTPDSALAQARDLWRASAVSEYQYTLTTTCYCLPESPITVVVKNDTVVEAYYADTLENVPADRRATLPTLAGLFTKVERAYAANAAQVDVTFHTTLGYVQSLYIDQDRRMADEEIGYRVSNVIIAANGLYEVTAVKYTGERQCEGGGVSIETLQSQLTAAGNGVVAASCGWDGRVYPAVCGAGSGKIGVFTLMPSRTPPRLPEGFQTLSQVPDARITSCP